MDRPGPVPDDGRTSSRMRVARPARSHIGSWIVSGVQCAHIRAPRRTAGRLVHVSGCVSTPLGPWCTDILAPELLLEPISGAQGRKQDRLPPSASTRSSPVHPRSVASVAVTRSPRRTRPNSHHVDTWGSHAFCTAGQPGAFPHCALQPFFTAKKRCPQWEGFPRALAIATSDA